MNNSMLSCKKIIFYKLVMAQWREQTLFTIDYGL